MMRIPSILTSIVFLSASCVYAASNVTVNSVGHAQPRTLFGLMFEDINHSGDGGLYAELLQNRAFQTVQSGTSNSLTAWSSLGFSQISVVAAVPPVSAALPNALAVTAPTNATGEIGFSNSGFWGINVKSEWTFTGSFYYRFPGEGVAGSFKVALRSADGTVEFASASVPFDAASEWTKAEFSFQPTSSANGINNIFVVSLDGEAVKGTTLQFALFSLFPPTFKGRKNGMRIDLSETLADMKPTIFRWPGGNNLEGSTVANRWKWFNTLGDLLERPGRPGDWSYPNTDGLGIFEYLQWVEDMGMESIMGVYAGYSLRGETVPEADIGPYVEEAINQVHFAIGDPATNEWAARRAALGHPEPFDVKYIEIGNEDFFAPDSYHAYRWRAFYNGLSAVFPDLKYIATSGESAAVPDISPAPDHWDLHIYSNPKFFREGSYNFDVAPRNGLQFFQGEYAVTRADDGSRVPYPTIEAAVAEAAYLTGFDRNSDIVFATAYAPLLNHINSTQWTPDLISFSPNTVIRSTSYYVQRFFGTYKGDTYLTSTNNNASNPLQWSVTQSTNKSEIYFKVVNTALAEDTIVFTLPPTSTILSDTGHGSVLTASLGTANTPEHPNAAVPVDFDFTVGEGGVFSYNVPALSASVLIVSAQA